MSEVRILILVAIYTDVHAANLNFDAIVNIEDLPSEVPFDAAVAVKAEDGTVAIVREHLNRENSSTRSGAGKGGAVGLLAMLIPGVGPAAALTGLIAGAAIGGTVESRAVNERRESFKQSASEAIDAGEALLAVVCPADEARRFDDLLSNARLVLRVNPEDVPRRP